MIRTIDIRSDAADVFYAWVLDMAEGPVATDPVFLDNLHGGQIFPGLTLWAGTSEAPVSDLFALYEDTLSPDEMARARRFRSEMSARLYLVAHHALRVLLGRALGQPPASLTFQTGAQGKPKLAGAADPPIHFNISHTNGRVFIGLSPVPIGVDVERLRPMERLLDMARLSFAPDTVDALHACPQDARHAFFFRNWVLGEAYIKATGLGISQGLKSFRFSNSGAPKLVQATPGWGPESRWHAALRHGVPGVSPFLTSP